MQVVRIGGFKQLVIIMNLVFLSMRIKNLTFTGFILALNCATYADIVMGYDFDDGAGEPQVKRFQIAIMSSSTSCSLNFKD